MNSGIALFIALIGVPIACYQGWKVIGRMHSARARMLLRSLLLAIIMAPVPLFGHGFIILPGIVVLFFLGIMLPDGINTAFRNTAIWFSSAALITWIIFIVTAMVIGAIGKRLKGASNGNKVAPN